MISICHRDVFSVSELQMFKLRIRHVPAIFPWPFTLSRHYCPGPVDGPLLPPFQVCVGPGWAAELRRAQGRARRRSRRRLCCAGGSETSGRPGPAWPTLTVESPTPSLSIMISHGTVSFTSREVAPLATRARPWSCDDCPGRAETFRVKDHPDYYATAQSRWPGPARRGQP